MFLNAVELSEEMRWLRKKHCVIKKAFSFIRFSAIPSFPCMNYFIQLVVVRAEYLGPVVQKPINANPSLKINQLRSLFLHSQSLFNADILQNFTLEEVKL